MYGSIAVFSAVNYPPAGSTAARSTPPLYFTADTCSSGVYPHLHGAFMSQLIRWSPAGVRTGRCPVTAGPHPATSSTQPNNSGPFIHVFNISLSLHVFNTTLSLHVFNISPSLHVFNIRPFPICLQHKPFPTCLQHKALPSCL